MMSFRSNAAIACLLVLAAATAAPAARAGEVKMYDRVPSVEELSNTLSGAGAPKAHRSFQVRKIELGDTSPGSSSSGGAPAVAAPAVDAVGFPINFGYNSADIMDESRPYVDVMGQLLTKQPGLRMTVEGHTDGAGSDEYNNNLSARRAAAVKRYLVDSHGIAPSRLKTVGKGKSDPLYRDNPLDPKNRRVQFRPAG
ncbi:MAG: OmpA family protein [Alphaproteobacteria bacterium]